MGMAIPEKFGGSGNSDFRYNVILQEEASRALVTLVAGELSGADAAIAKLFCTEMQARAVDRCLQLFGGYGYINEYPIARLYADARVTRIYGGTSEVMKSIISAARRSSCLTCRAHRGRNRRRG
jgi:alkylation response protein AidB-like acyl-CoA dehydrogenase